jgi:hypothetical protein
MLKANAPRSRRSMYLCWIMLLVPLGNSWAAPAAATKPASHGVHLGSYRVERDVTPSRDKVVGTLTNVGRVRVHSARVSFRLFDANGHVIGRATDEVHDLDPGHTWKFHAIARGNVSRARLLRVETR